MSVQEHTLTLDESPVFYREAPTPGPTPVYLHTAPTSSEDWTPLLERTGGIAPDLIGFGRSAKGGHLDYSPRGMAEFVAAVLRERGVERVVLAGHGWGAAVAVELAGREPGRVERLLLVDPAPPLGEARWPRLSRWWRTPVLGELVMGSLNRALLARWLRGASAQPESWPEDRVRGVWDQFDQGTQRATLRLHRWAAHSGSAELAATLESLTIPTSLLWGGEDPWFPPALAPGWTDRIPNAEVEVIDGAGHWPWFDRPEIADRIANLMAGR